MTALAMGPAGGPAPSGAVYEGLRGYAAMVLDSADRLLHRCPDGPRLECAASIARARSALGTGQAI